MVRFVETKPDNIEKEIISEITKFCKNTRKEWGTKEIKEILIKIARNRNYDVWTNGVSKRLLPPKFCHEWLYDICWLEPGNDDYTNAPLVGEIEWKRSGVADDFMKLVFAKADHRLMIFTKKIRQTAKEAAEGLLLYAEKNKHSSSGDRYLFGVWDVKNNSFEWLVYEAVAR